MNERKKRGDGKRADKQIETNVNGRVSGLQ
jgi:hypothetical protein